MLSWIRHANLVIATLLALALAARAQAGFTVVDLGPVGSGQSGGATGINASGATSGFASGSGGVYQAASSAAGAGFRAINTSPLPGVSGSVADAINGAGDVAGTFYDTNDRLYHAFKTTNGQAVDLGTFTSGQFRGADTFGAGISGSGEVVGTARLFGGSQVVFRSAGPGQISTILLPNSSSVGQAAGVNDAGTIVGSYLNAQGVSRVFAATGNQAVDVLAQYPTRGFGLNTYGSAINDKGDITGYGDFGGQSHAFYAATDAITGAKTFIDLGVTGGYGSSVSQGLNNFGQVVGMLGNGGADSRAFLWDQSIGLLDLNALLAPDDQKQWTLTVAAGINDSGQIAGQGYVNGQLHGFVLTPVPGSFPFFTPAVVPAPPSLWMALGGLGMTGAWYRFKLGIRLRRG